MVRSVTARGWLLVCVGWLAAGGLVFSSVSPAWGCSGSGRVAWDDDDHGHGRGGGHNFFGVSPFGMTYGYHDQNFGFAIDMPFERATHNHRPAYPAAPVMVEPVYEPPVVVRSAAAPSRAAEPRPPRIETHPDAIPFQRAAEAAFRDHEYAIAAKAVDHAVVEDPQNGKLQLFASQAKFAVGDYRGAVLHLDAATELLPPSQWGFVVENFRWFYNNNDYVRQMERLVEASKAEPESGWLRTLRGYHYRYLQHEESARKQLRRAIEVDADDRLAWKLLAELGEEIPAPQPDQN